MLFVNPTEREMMPCPYYLEGSCKYSDNQCHYSHGELIPFSKLREYRYLTILEYIIYILLWTISVNTEQHSSQNNN